MAANSHRAPPLERRYGRLLSCSLPCPGVSLQDFLAAADGQARCYWENPNSRLAFAGAGAAVELMAWGGDRFRKIARDVRALFRQARIDADMPPWAGPRLFGGFSFRHDFTPDKTWSIYAPAHFVLPHYQLARVDDEAWLTINAQIPPDEDVDALASELRAALREKIDELRPLGGSEKLGRAHEKFVSHSSHERRGIREQGAANRPIDNRQSPLRSVSYPMPYETWQALIETATARIGAGELTKVVLARAAELRFAGRARLLPVLAYLTAHYAGCYRFLFEPRAGFAFYGASPELLASARGKRIDTMAMAGSIARGSDRDDDLRLGEALLDSPKNRQEQAIVARKIRDRLLPMTDTLDIAPTALFKLRHIQHLHSPIRGRLRRETGILPLVQALHPTPALGGDPRHRALRLIRELEPIPRGWYGAPVGWIDAKLDGQFAVAIRSAVAQEARVWIYAGAGIVRDSQADAEWQETALKFRPMLDAHGG